ncbi:hypothetical protein [Actinomadura roseirufa]|uniref:hypothetical protein n=1 Tax=Actinomadura roseirufa TaxID=2094049 RepID=UPI001041BB2D|nr:hypothetical protein [Actinomadura roseirufa]
MDDQRMIRSFLAEAPPSAEVIAEGRRRVLAQARPRPRPRGMTFRLSLGVAATAAATAVAVALSGGFPSARTTQGTELTARQMLLAAAHGAASAPAGRYLHSHVINGQAYHVAAGDYVITGAQLEIDQWIGRTDETDDVFRSRFAGAQPQKAADRAAWQRAGSPPTWSVLSNGGQIQQTTATEPWDIRRTTPAQKKQATAYLDAEAKKCATTPQTCGKNKMLTQRQREALADDRTALRRELRSRSGEGGPGNELTRAGSLLAQSGSPKLNAAVFRVLADTPGIRNAGKVTDTRGRTAIALAARVSDERGTFDTELLLQPRTYRVLGTQTVLVSGKGAETAGMKPGTIYTQQLFLELGWTDSAPH